MKSFNINRSSAAGIQIWFYLGYFLLAIPAGQLMRRFGYKAGIVTGLCLLGSGCLLFYPAAQAGIYAFFLVAQFVIASGLSFLETGRNSFIAQLGPAGSSQRGAPAEFRAGVQSVGKHYGCACREPIHFLRH